MGNRIVNGVVEEGVKVRPRASSKGEFFFFSSDTPIELPGVFRIALPLCEISLIIYIFLFPSSWPSICRLCRSPLECLFHPVFPSTCCESQWAVWHYLGVIPSLMRPDSQLWAFSAKVTGSSTLILSPCSYSCPSTLVPSFRDDGEGCGGCRIVLSSQETSC